MISVKACIQDLVFQNLLILQGLHEMPKEKMGRSAMMLE